MRRYGITLLISAFLLFLIQPLVARKLLPELGGTATIWTTCMMFFQVALFLGYLYAHLLRVGFKPAIGWAVHSGLIVVAVGWLWAQPFAGQPIQSGELSMAVTLKLTTMIGLPFIILSATSPLVQAWHSLSHPHQQTYRLYALSNLGSLLALVCYPFLFDPWIDVPTQSRIWFIGFLLFAAAMIGSGLQVRRSDVWPVDLTPNQVNRPMTKPKTYQFWTLVWWVLLSATASVLLIATSNILCQEVASFPFLWLVPLVCYLVTLIVCFDWPPIYQRWIFQPAFAVSCYLAILVYHFGSNLGLIGQTLGCCAVLTTGCMICHGELVRLKPQVQQLTYFYLAVAFGGALGGILSVIVAPRVFNRFFEFHFALLAILALASILFSIETWHRTTPRRRHVYLFFLTAGLALVPVGSSLYYFLDPKLNDDVLFQGRNEYGLISVEQADGYRFMRSGSTNHGGQFSGESERNQPFAYYGKGSGAERAFSLIRSTRQPGESIHVGVIGLGTGSLLAYSRPGDRFRFYEINPMVEQIAVDYFDFIPADHAAVILGDGRIELERELMARGPNRFDILFLDAFSSDSIPVHLLTDECFELYFRHIKQDGILVAHITNKFVDLNPVLASIADSNGLNSVQVQYSNAEFQIQTDWILFSRDSAAFSNAAFSEPQLQWKNHTKRVVWTDSLSSVLPVVKWRWRANSNPTSTHQ